MARNSSKVIAKKAAPKSKAVPAICGDSVRVSTTDRKGVEKTVAVRQIENGFIVRESTYTPKGGFTERERFSATAPTLDFGKLKKK